MTTLLEAVNQAQAELGLTQSSIVASSQDLTAQQFFALVNRTGDSIQKANDWTNLQLLQTITVEVPTETTGDVTLGSYTISNIPSTAGLVANQYVVSGNALTPYTYISEVVDSTTVTVNMPATDTVVGMDITFSRTVYPFEDDFSRFINRTFWDRTNRWEVLGPDTPQIDEWHQSGIVVTGPRRHFRQVGATPYALRLWPPPGATEPVFTTAFEYISKNWAETAAGVGIPRMTSDDDVFRIDSDAVVLELKWRWLQAKQLAYAAQQAESNDYIRMLQARDGGARTLNMSSTFSPYLITSMQVADGYFPGN